MRRALASDAAGMVSVLQPIVAAKVYSAMTEEITLESQKAYLEKALPDGMFFVATDGPTGAIVGLQNIEPSGDAAGEISTFVALDRRGEQIGHALATKTLADARERGLREVIASIRASNESAIRFYSSLGFEDRGARSRQAVHGHEEEIAHLTLRLS